MKMRATKEITVTQSFATFKAQKPVTSNEAMNEWTVEIKRNERCYAAGEG